MTRSILLATLAACALAQPAFAGGLDECGLEPPGGPLWQQVPPRPDERPVGPNDRPVVTRESRPRGSLLHFGTPAARLREGALSGKTVYVSAGHGFTWTKALNRWATQRPNTHGVVEDLVSTETISQFLVPMLQGAGAYVVPIRETDLNPHRVVVDDLDPDYSESGPAETFMDSSVAGYGAPPVPLTNGTNPFELGKNRLMEATTSGTPTASATWAFNVPEDGFYNVYVSYTPFTYRVPDAHYVVKHAGGEAHFRINQRRRGRTWVLLGRFYFKQGKDAAKGAITALNDSSVVGNVSLDAVRIGGGMGLVAGNDNGTPKTLSNRPRFEECARYSAQYLGAPPSVYDNASLDDRSDDVGTRSRFAAWDHEAGEDAVYVAWHTNACGTTVCNFRGTDTYIYGDGAPWENAPFSGVAGSDVLAQFVHGELVKDLRSGWDPIENDGTAWSDRGIHTAYFGELNPSHNPETPAILLEVAFHHNVADATQLKEPYFRYIAARAIAQGIIKYFADKDQKAAALPPEPPLSLAARNVGNGRVRLSWSPAPVDSSDLGGAVATGFRVYASDDGVAWDDGTDVTGTMFELTLAPEQVRYFRVSATNDGGESFPSTVAGVRVPQGGGLAPVLVVNGFDRFDAALGQTHDLSAYSLGSVTRIFVDRLNDGSYVRRHGFALAQNGVAFDSADWRALAGTGIDPSAYALIDFFAGRGVSAGQQIDPAILQKLRTYVESGGRVIVSGSSVASGLSASGADGQQFLAQVLGVSGAAAGGGASVDGVAGEALDGLSAILLDDGAHGAYPAGAPDVLTPGSGTALARYTGTMDVAGVRLEGTGKAAFLGFPFEAVRSEAHRVEIMARLLTTLNVPIAPIPYDGGTTTPDPDAGVPDAGGIDLEPILLVPVAGNFPNADAGGCGCTSSGAYGIAAFLLPILPLLAGRMRRRRSAR